MKAVRILFMLIFLLSACSTPQGTTLPAAGPLTVVIAEIGNGALFRASADAEFTPAQTGQTLPAGGELVTGGSAGARLEFSDGTRLRMQSISYIKVLELNSDPAGPAARIQLTSGKLWIILKGGDLEVETSSGTAVVKGSYMSVGFDSTLQAMDVTCLEGACALQNDLGATELSDGQAAGISGANLAPSAAQAMNDEQRAEWVQVNPEAVAITGPVPISPAPSPTPYLASANGTVMDVGFFSQVDPGTHHGYAWFPYYFENNCLGGAGKLSRTPWHWYFDFFGRDTIYTMAVTILPGEARHGYLPVGEYLAIRDWTDEGTISNYTADKTYAEDANLNIILCPDDPRLPGTH